MFNFVAVEEALEWAERNKVRIRVHYGDVKTGRDWGDIYHVAGHIGRSMGPNQIRLLVHNRRSMGGGGLLEGCIVRIRYANRADGGDLYRHPAYEPPDRLTFYDPDRTNVWERNFA